MSPAKSQEQAPQKMIRVDASVFAQILSHRARMELKTGQRATLGEALKDLLNGKKA